jgi:hypothetical protein
VFKDERMEKMDGWINGKVEKWKDGKTENWNDELLDDWIAGLLDDVIIVNWLLGLQPSIHPLIQ